MPTTAIDFLKDMHGRSHGIMTGSGTSALVLSLWALGLHGKRIAIPNGVCYSVPLAVILSGNEPVYLDIDGETLSLGVSQLKEYRTWYDAVIAVHNYGARCDIEGIAEFCAKENLPLIEDCCVALGAEDIGHWGDISVFSFGAGKIVDVGGSGALLCDDGEVVDDAWHLGGSFARKPDVFMAADVSDIHTQLYNRFYSEDRRRLSVFRVIAESCSRDLLQRQFWLDPHHPIMSGLKDLQENVSLRARKAFELWERLNECGEVWKPSTLVWWRFNIYIESGRNNLLRNLHDKGYKASSWHAPADLFFKGRTALNAHRTPMTDWVADHILNLWVDHTVGDEYIEGVSREVREWTKL